ncbi:hypothetical protein B0H17DRAFT_1081308, partial [Mycena rosella]
LGGGEVGFTPSTIYRWARESTVRTILGTSRVNVSWTIEDGTAPGTYRIRTSSNFTVS